jgi:hypothetical protein
MGRHYRRGKQMIKALITTAALFTATTAGASGLCQVIGGVAEAVMQNRQSGILMSDQMAVASTIEHDAARGLTQDMVIAAYRAPMFSTDTAKQRIILEFRNEAEAACYELGYE